jgi:glycosyltransferase involved in cell wall biosynthesis
MNERLLVFNCHEAWVYQLERLGVRLDIVVDLPGRHTRVWDEAMRPIPKNARLVTLAEILEARESYDCIIAHNLTDLLDSRTLVGPRMMVIHIAVETLILDQKSKTSAEDFRSMVAQFVRQTRTHVVAVSEFKGRSWGFPEDVVLVAADPADYLEWKGDVPRGLRVSNFVLRRPQCLLWDFHERAFAGIPMTLMGHNPEIAGVAPSRGWADLKETFSHHRFYIHTADPRYEDGYNMATLEAMAAGLPVLGNRHPSSPITHGVDGFLSDDAAELNRYARLLLDDRELAGKMGRAAQRKVAERFASKTFCAGMKRSIALAQRLWSSSDSQSNLHPRVWQTSPRAVIPPRRSHGCKRLTIREL